MPPGLAEGARGGRSFFAGFREARQSVFPPRPRKAGIREGVVPRGNSLRIVEARGRHVDLIRVAAGRERELRAAPRAETARTVFGGSVRGRCTRGECQSVFANGEPGHGRGAARAPADRAMAKRLVAWSPANRVTNRTTMATANQRVVRVSARVVHPASKARPDTRSTPGPRWSRSFGPHGSRI
jgi:hypothetical protein